MSEEDRLDIIETRDEDGQEHFLLVEKYFYYNGQEYVLLRQVMDDQGTPRAGEAQRRVMLVEVTQDQDGEEVEDFVPVADSLEESLLRSASIHYAPPEELTAPDE